MPSIHIAPTAVGEVTEETLKLGPTRLLTFLQGVSDPAIRAQFAVLGWSDERFDEAWSLLSELRAANKIPAAIVDPIAQAIASCEAWQSTGLIRARAMLQLSFPEQAAFIFHDFVAGAGMEAVLNVSTFLERRKALENGPERSASRDADGQALAVLTETGVTPEVLAQLHAFVETVHTVATVQPQELADAEARRTEVLRKIHAWVMAWSEMARTVITRRDQMIKLGIAKRRSHKNKADVVVTPVVPAIPELAPPASAGDEPSPESRAA
jgi:hypothetical protein